MNLSCRLLRLTAMIGLITATMGTPTRPILAQTPAPTKNSCPPASPGTPVQSVETGNLGYAEEQGGYGNSVVVNHLDGRQTRYAHLNQILPQNGSVG
jgi:hypothetical protein